MSKKSFRPAARVFETLKKFQKRLILMVRDTLLGFPPHSLPYCYRKLHQFIDGLIDKHILLERELCSGNRCHRLTRANTPSSAPLRRFLSFSPWRAPARLRLKSQKSLENPSLVGVKQFCRAEMRPDKERPAGNTCRISKGHNAVWAHFCPSKPCLPLLIDGNGFCY